MSVFPRESVVFGRLLVPSTNCQRGCLRRGMLTPTCFPVRALVLVKPGGSGMLEAFFDLAGNPLFRSTTHLGGAGFIFAGEWHAENLS